MWDALDHAFDEALAASNRFWQRPSVSGADECVAASLAVCSLFDADSPWLDRWIVIVQRWRALRHREARRAATGCAA